ncbi:MAG: LysR family transcriptional regulator [Lautropia sp.]
MAPLGVEQWRLFVQIADHGSLTRAAAARDVAQSAVSRQLAAIEAQCGGRLFERHGRGVRLTDAGARLYPRVVAWLESGDELARDVRRAVREPAGIVRLGVLASIELDLVGTVHRELQARFPAIRLWVVDGNGGRLADWLGDGSIDLALLSRNGREGRRGELPIATMPLLLIGPAGDRLTRAATVPFRRLDGLPLVLPGAPNAFRDLLDHWARRKGISLELAIECDAFPIQKQLTATLGLHTILAGSAVRDDVADGRLQAARIVEPVLQRTITLGLTETRPPTPACREVARIVRAVATRMLAADGDRGRRRRGGRPDDSN